MEIGIMAILLAVVFISVYVTIFLWPQFLPDKTEAEIVGFHEVPNFGRGSSFRPYFYYSILRFVLDGEVYELMVRRDKRDKLGEKVPVAYSRRFGVVLRRRWIKLYLREEMTWGEILHIIFYDILFFGSLTLIGIVTLIVQIKTQKFLFATIFLSSAAVVITVIITIIHLAMEQKEFNLARTEPGEGTNVIKVYQRTIFDNKWCLYFSVGSISWMVVLLCMWAAFPELRTFEANIYWYSVIGISIFLLSIIIYSLIQVVVKNCIIKNGEIIWATIDKTETYWDNGEFFVSCIWFSTEEGMPYHFEARYKDSSDNLRPDLELECRKRLLAVGQIPVAVNSKNKEKYVVLVKDCMFSYIGNGTLRPITGTSLLRTVKKQENE